MINPMPQPILFLTTANDRDDRAYHLRTMAEDADATIVKELFQKRS